MKHRAFRLSAFTIRLLGSRGRCRFIAEFGNTVGEEIDYVEPVHILLTEEIDSVRILLAENRDEDVGTGYFLPAG